MATATYLSIDEDMPSKYFHIMACNRGAFADTNGAFADSLNRYTMKLAESSPKDFIYCPSDW